MGTIAVWAFFILWGGALIGALLNWKLTLTFNIAFQMYVVRDFLVGRCAVDLEDSSVRILRSWLALFLSCTIGAIIRLRQQARGKRETAGRVSWSLETPPEEWHQGIRRGETYAQIHSTKDAVVRFCQVGIPTLLAWNLLPTAWYWRIGTILVLPFVIGLIVALYREGRRKGQAEVR